MMKRGDHMLFHIGDYVTRKSHNHDTIFKIIDLQGTYAILKGHDVRLIADSDIDDLVKVTEPIPSTDQELESRIDSLLPQDRNEYFYLPGKILHIDADDEYLNRCIEFYKKLNIMAYGVKLNERSIGPSITKYLEDLNPDIVVITGHDAYYRNKDEYKNSDYFVDAVKMARKYEKSHDKLIIVAGACQSNYEEIIKAGANFASSPKRINIHAIDPAIIASSISLSLKNKPIDLLNILSKTKYGPDGIGGLVTTGTMYVGYPR